MRFQYYGRTCQLQIETVADLKSILDLNEALWAASSAPVSVFRVDPKFLAFLDADANGRITTDELKQAIRWFTSHLLAPEDAMPCSDRIPLAAINRTTASGTALADSAAYVLSRVQSDSPETISLSQVRTFLSSFQALPLNGDGVIVSEAAADPETVSFLTTVCSATGGTADVSGRTGVTQAQLDSFMSAIPEHLAWRQRGELPADRKASELMPFGEETRGLYELYSRHAGMIDHYFELCDLVAFEPALAAKLASAPPPAAPAELMQSEQIHQRLGALPIAVPSPAAELSLLRETINPSYRDWLAELEALVLCRIVPDTGRTLTRANWQKVKSVFGPLAAYLSKTPGTFLSGIPTAQLETYVDGRLAAKARELIESDRKVAGILLQAREVERLLLYHVHLMRFANNFVSFPQLYAREERALFEMGSAVIDGRWLSFALRVDDLPGHAAVAKLSSLYVLYLEITGLASEKFVVASPVTSGSKGNLCVGKRGVFFDVSGREYDARVIQVAENPVSLREALAMPFLRLWRLAEGKLETWSSAAEKDMEKTVTAPTNIPVPQPAVSRPSSPGSLGPLGNGAFMGLGVTVAALGSAFAFVTKTFAGLHLTQLAFGFLATALAVMLPVTLIAIVKLRRQDLSSLLEASGWAINARMRLSRAQRRFFTRGQSLPIGALKDSHGLRLRLLIALGILLAVLSVALRIWNARH